MNLIIFGIFFCEGFAGLIGAVDQARGRREAQTNFRELVTGLDEAYRAKNDRGRLRNEVIAFSLERMAQMVGEPFDLRMNKVVFVLRSPYHLSVANRNLP